MWFVNKKWISIRKIQLTTIVEMNSSSFSLSSESDESSEARFMMCLILLLVVEAMELSNVLGLKIFDLAFSFMKNMAGIIGEIARLCGCSIFLILWLLVTKRRKI